MSTPGHDPNQRPVGRQNFHHGMHQQEDHGDEKNGRRGDDRPALPQERHQTKERHHEETRHALGGRFLVNRQARHEQEDGAGADGQGQSLQGLVLRSHAGGSTTRPAREKGANFGPMKAPLAF